MLPDGGKWNIGPLIPTQYKIEQFKFAFEVMLFKKGMKYIEDENQACYRSLYDTWMFFFKFFITQKATKYITPLHELVQDFEYVEQSIQDSEAKDDIFEQYWLVSSGCVKATDFKYRRRWFYDSETQTWGTNVNLFAAISTDSFNGPYPNPQKTFVHCFTHMFYKGLDQLSFFYIFIKFVVYLFLFVITFKVTVIVMCIVVMRWCKR